MAEREPQITIEKQGPILTLLDYGKGIGAVAFVLGLAGFVQMGDSSGLKEATAVAAKSGAVLGLASAVTRHVWSKIDWSFLLGS